MRLLYCVLAEGRYRNWPSKDDMEVYLRHIDEWTTVAEMKEAYADRDAFYLINLFERYRTLGLPLGGKGWMEHPEWFVQLVESLKPIYEEFHPRAQGLL